MNAGIALIVRTLDVKRVIDVDVAFTSDVVAFPEPATLIGCYNDAAWQLCPELDVC